jgi:hypothetical protein
MPYLKYYRTEREKYKEAFSQKLESTKEIKIVIGKLLRHFKLRQVQVGWNSGNRTSYAGNNGIVINVDNGKDFGTICHEVAHIYQLQKLYNSKYESWHNKEHEKIFKRMINYCKKKNWFQVELKRRTAIKTKKVITREDLREIQIQKLQRKIKQYEKKIKIYSNKLKKAQKSLKLRLTYLERKKLSVGSSTIEDYDASDSSAYPEKECQCCSRLTKDLKIFKLDEKDAIGYFWLCADCIKDREKKITQAIKRAQGIEQ